MSPPMRPATAAPGEDRRRDHFADGTELAYTIRTDDPAVYHLFTADLGRRLRSAQVHLPATGSDRSFGAFRTLAPGRGDARRSTTTHGLPSGAVTVSIDATDAGSHGYLRYHVEAAVAYTRALDVDVGRASLLAGLLLALAAGLVATGRPLLAAPLFGAGMAIAGPVALNRLAAHGVPLSLTRWDVPPPR